MGRTILAVLAGIAVMWLTVSGIEFLSHALYPPPPGLDPTDPTALAKVIAASPPAARRLGDAGLRMGCRCSLWGPDRCRHLAPA